jgi:hypothetical protein
MMLARTGIGVSGLVAAAAVLVAAATIWLMLTDPAAVADAVTSGGGRAFVIAVADLIIEALRQAVRWL